MNIVDYIRVINYNWFRSNSFKREVEKFYYSDQKISLPIKVDSNNIENFRKNYFLDFEIFKNELLLIENQDEVLKQANNVLDNKFNLFGYHLIDLAKINWKHDYLSDYEWKDNLIFKMKLSDTPNGADLSVPFQISRMHQLCILGKAYIITKDEKYSIKYSELLSSFLNDNKFCASINWLDSVEVSIRLINVIISFGYFKNSIELSESFLMSIFEFIQLSAIYIENNLEYSSKANYKFLVNLSALAAASSIIPNTPYGNRLKEFAYRNLEEQVRKQILSDGWNVDQALHFIPTILESLYLSKFFLSSKKFSNEFDLRVKSLGNVLLNLVNDDNSLASFGDDPISRMVLFNTSDYFNELSYPLPIIGALYKDPNYKKKKTSFETLIIAGKEKYEEYENLKRIDGPIKSFCGGGYAVLRDHDVIITIKAGDLGVGAPSHNDTFSYEISYKNNLVVVDSGTYKLYGDEEKRNSLRSEKAHNIAMVDDEQLADFEGLNKIKADYTKPKILDWQTNNDEDILVVQHHAYTRLVDPVIRKRTFVYSKTNKTLKIKDEFFGSQKHQAAINMHFHPAVKLNSVNHNVYSASINDNDLDVKFSSSSENLKSAIMSSLYSDRYNQLHNSKRIYLLLQDHFPTFFITEICFK